MRDITLIWAVGTGVPFSHLYLTKFTTADTTLSVDHSPLTEDKQAADKAKIIQGPMMEASLSVPPEVTTVTY